MTRTGLALSALAAGWLTQAALRGHAADTLTGAQTLVVLVIVAMILTLIAGVVRVTRRPPVRKAPRR